MEDYYYLTGKIQNGPFSIEELKTKNLSSETLIWEEGMENWQKLKDLPDLFLQLKPKSTPPPPPIDLEDKITKTEVSGQLKITSERTPNPIIETIKPTKKNLTWLIVWISFNLFALLMSYSEVNIFNGKGEHKTNKFWPFVDYTHKGGAYYNSDNKVVDISSPGIYRGVSQHNQFNGLFVNYDWTEFLFYSGGALIVFLLTKISNKKRHKV